MQVEFAWVQSEKLFSDFDHTWIDLHHFHIAALIGQLHGDDADSQTDT